MSQCGVAPQSPCGAVPLKKREKKRCAGSRQPIAYLDHPLSIPPATNTCEMIHASRGDAGREITLANAVSP
jgi:hypothetical protein